MYGAVNDLLEGIVEGLIERDLGQAIPTALSIVEANGYVLDDDLSLDELAEAFETIAEDDDLSLEEKDLLGKIGGVVRKAAATYGKAKGKHQANMDRWSAFKKSVSQAFAGGKEQGYKGSRSKWDKKTVDPRVARKADKAARKAKGAARTAKLKPGQKMVFGNVVNMKTAKKKRA